MKFILFVALATLLAQGPAYAKGEQSVKKIERVLARVLKNKALKGAQIGFAVAKANSGQFVIAHGADLKLNPASNVKLMTAAAALHLLRPQYRFKTEYYADGPIENGVLNGNLIVKGFGDPSVVTERLQVVARNLYLRGLRQVKGQVIYDETYFDSVREANGWSQEDQSFRAYAAPVGALSFNHNSIGVFVRPIAGQDAFVALDPPVDHVQLEGKIRTVAGASRLEITSIRKDGETIVKVGGEINALAEPQIIYRRVYEPARYFTSSLVDYLKQNGVKVGSSIKPGTVSGASQLLYTDYSPALAEIIIGMNHFSNNFISEMLVKAMGARVALPATFANGLAEISRFLEKDVGLKPGDYILGNGSGLNHVNSFTARQFAKLLVYAFNDFETAPEFVASLSVGGTQGTIKSRFKNSLATGKIRAKTGSLRGVTSLSGYVLTKRREVLAFSILMQGHVVPNEEIWRLEDQLGEALAEADFFEELGGMVSNESH